MADKIMNIGLQKYQMDKIARVRGNPAHRDIQSDSEDIKSEVALENFDSHLTLSENIQMLESEGILLPYSPNEEDDYYRMQFKRAQEEIETEEKEIENERIVKMMKKRYGLKTGRLKPKPVKKK